MVIGILISLAADLENKFAVPVVGRIQPGYVHLHAFHCPSSVLSGASSLKNGGHKWAVSKTELVSLGLLGLAISDIYALKMTRLTYRGCARI